MEEHNLGEKINKLLDGLNKGGKCKKMIYWILIMGIPIFSLLFGVSVTLLLCGGMMYVEHYGWFEHSSFGYMNLEQDSFKTTYYVNNSIYFQTLKISNSWKNDIGAKTKWEIKDEKTGSIINGIEIECTVDSPKQSCLDYQIEGTKHQILNLQIIIKNIPTKSYLMCFITEENQNNNNQHKDGLQINILPTQPISNI